MKRILFKSLAVFMTLALLFSTAACSAGAKIAETKDLTNKGTFTAEGTVSREVETDTEDPKGDGTSYELKIWCADEDYDMIAEMLSNYELERSKNTYTWKLQAVGEDVAASKVLADIGSGPDVFSFANDQMGLLNNSKALKKIPTKYKSQIESQINVAVTAAKSADGDYYAFPYSYENCFLYYNKSKITAVSSLEGILKAPIAGVSYNLGIDMSDSYYTTMFLYTAGVQIFGPEGTDATAVEGSLNNDNAIKACKYIKALYGEKKLTSVGKTDQTRALSTGEVAAMISGPHMISTFKSALGKNFAVATLPTIKLDGVDKPLISFAGVKMYGVTDKSLDDRNQKTTDEALRVAAYLSNAKNQEIRLIEREFCPTDEELFDEALEQGTDTVKVVVQQSDNAKLKPGLIQMGYYWEPMGSFLNAVYRSLKDESTWKTELANIEGKLKS